MYLGWEWAGWRVKAVGACVSSSSSPTAEGGGSGRGWDSASSPPESVDGTTQGLDGRV